MVKKITNILLSLLLLISVGGFSINMHYCHEKLYDLAVLSEAHSCCEDRDHSHLNSCNIENTSHKHSGDCETEDQDSRQCENKSVKIGSPDNFIITVFDYVSKSEPLVLFNTLLNSKDLLIHSEEHNLGHIVFNDKSPPDKGTSLAKLQTFRN